MTDLAQQYEELQRRFHAVDQRLGAVEQSIVELQRAQATLEGLQEAEGEREVLMPIGGGVFVHAKVDPARPVLHPLGADYATEGTMASALERLGQRATEAQQTYQRLAADAQKLGQQVQETAGRLQGGDEPPADMV